MWSSPFCTAAAVYSGQGNERYQGRYLFRGYRNPVSGKAILERKQQDDVWIKHLSWQIHWPVTKTDCYQVIFLYQIPYEDEFVFVRELGLDKEKGLS